MQSIYTNLVTRFSLNTTYNGIIYHTNLEAVNNKEKYILLNNENTKYHTNSAAAALGFSSKVSATFKSYDIFRRTESGGEA